MTAALQRAGFTVTIKSGWVTITKDGWDESYKTLRSAYNDKLNQ